MEPQQFTPANDPQHAENGDTANAPVKKSKNKILLLSAALALTVAVCAVLGYLLFVRDAANESSSESKETTSDQITNFDECVAAGNPVMESFPEQCSADGKTFTNEVQQDDIATDTGFDMVVESGMKAFSMIIPDGWEVIKPLDQDSFYVMGLLQPENKRGTDPKVEEMESFGTDAPSVFSVVLLDEYDEAFVRGEAEPFSVNKNADNITAKKYTYIYEEDEPEPEAIGQQRFKGDRDYTYVLTLPSGKVIIAFYAVYGVDPSNNIELVDQVINSIKLN